MLRLLKDDSGASAAEYALIVAVVGVPIALATLAFGTPIHDQVSYIETTAPNGTVYQCTSNCLMAYEDYCSAIKNRDNVVHTGVATWSPTLPASDPSCS